MLLHINYIPTRLDELKKYDEHYSDVCCHVSFIFTASWHLQMTFSFSMEKYQHPKIQINGNGVLQVLNPAQKDKCWQLYYTVEMQCILTKNTLYKYHATCINISCFVTEPQQVTKPGCQPCDGWNSHLTRDVSYDVCHRRQDLGVDLYFPWMTRKASSESLETLERLPVLGKRTMRQGSWVER